MAEALSLRHNPGNFTRAGFYGISPLTTSLDHSEQAAVLPTPRKEIPEVERERVFEVFDELREALRKRFREQLCAASDEAEAIGDPAIVPLKGEARTACLNIANIAAERCFFADRLQLVATAKINGGAVFVGRNPLNARRIDVEIEPGGSSAEFVATQRAETVSEFSYDLDEDVFRSWLDWLLRPS
ncbi:MAG: hypothetical protein ACHBNF_11055 [Chromatiales bacterium]